MHIINEFVNIIKEIKMFQDKLASFLVDEFVTTVLQQGFSIYLRQIHMEKSSEKERSVTIHNSFGNRNISKQ